MDTKHDWVDPTRCLAAFAVVALHVSGATLFSIQKVNSLDFFVANIYDSCTRWAVPVFFVISGFLLLDPSRRNETVSQFLGVRLKRIIAPGLFWSLVYTFWTFTCLHQTDLRSLLNRIVGGAPYYHLWFMTAIFGLYSITPILRNAIYSLTTPAVTVFVLSMLAFSMLDDFANHFYVHNKKTFYTLFMPYLPFYASGHLLHRLDFNKLKTPLTVAISFTGIAATAILFQVFTLFSMPNSARYFYNQLSVTTVLATLGIVLTCIKYKPSTSFRNVARMLAPLTLGVYLIHPLIIDVCNLFSVGPSNLSIPFVSVPLFTALIFLTAACCTALFKRIPGLSAIV